MKKFTLALFALAAALAITPAALADDATWNWTANGSVTGSGTITYSSTPDLAAGFDSYDITGITGTFDGYAITGLVPSANGYGPLHYTAAYPEIIIDDSFYPNNDAPGGLTYAGYTSTSGGYLDLFGVGFSLANGDFGMIYGNGGTDYGVVLLNPAGRQIGGNVSGDSFQVPDGGTTLLLLGLAVGGLAGLRRKLSA